MLAQAYVRLLKHKINSESRLCRIYWDAWVYKSRTLQEYRIITVQRWKSTGLQCERAFANCRRNEHTCEMAIELNTYRTEWVYLYVCICTSVRFCLLSRMACSHIECTLKMYSVVIAPATNKG